MEAHQPGRWDEIRQRVLADPASRARYERVRRALVEKRRNRIAGQNAGSSDGLNDGDAGRLDETTPS